MGFGIVDVDPLAFVTTLLVAVFLPHEECTQWTIHDMSHGQVAEPGQT
jgi:hypothetical protein